MEDLLIQLVSFIIIFSIKKKKDYSNETPVHWAVRENQEISLKILIKYQAILDSQNDDHETPLLLAVSLNHQNIVQVFFSY